MSSLHNILSSISEHIQQISSLQVALASANLILLIFAKPLIRLLIRDRQMSEDELFSGRAFILLKRVNWISLISVVCYTVILPLNQRFWFTKVLSVLMIIAGANLLNSILEIFILERFGKLRRVEGEERYVETYRSRLVSLLITLVTGVISVLLIVQVIGFKSLLETGGVLGFIGVLLALTQGAWAPDIISGLILLNSQSIEEGDVIELTDPKPIIGAVFKTRLFHTELLDLSTNHRVMIPNAQLRQGVILNLSKFASAKGLRERLTFKIGYDVRQSEVQRLFQDIFEAAQLDSEIPINDLHPLEVRVLDAGNYAIEWGVFYYLKEVKQVLSARHKLTALIVQHAAEAEISLATPILHQSI